MFSDPETVVPYFGLMEGMKVADFGAGSGHYSVAMSKRVGGGKVYAIDVQKDLLTRLESEAKRAGARNIQIIWGNVEKAGGTKLDDQSVDLVLIANLLFQTDQKYSVVLEAKRILRPEGKVAVIDWADSFQSMGPIADQVIKPEEAKKVLAQAGLTFLNDFPAGAHHWGLLFSKPSAVQ